MTTIDWVLLLTVSGLGLVVVTIILLSKILNVLVQINTILLFGDVGKFADHPAAAKVLDNLKSNS